VAYITAEARQQLLDAVAGAVDDIGSALASLGEAYEQLDDYNADKLESELFGPIQLAYGRAKRTYGGFAERYDLAGRAFEPAIAGHPSQGVRGFLDGAAGAAGEADAALSALQDSMMPVEVGDAELRAGLAEVRSLLAGLPGRTREFVRLLGR
jgi:hypothetical protein